HNIIFTVGRGLSRAAFDCGSLYGIERLAAGDERNAGIAALLAASMIGLNFLLGKAHKTIAGYNELKQYVSTAETVNKKKN
ncbi:hypothetical protein KY345_04070, partial [Candidatus Woesearchaeota archaeon]|nr:hypothetical protein [Candidatus Woesearchaeota archaeon]